jgi:murein L,D-transpeptidase YafK
MNKFLKPAFIAVFLTVTMLQLQGQTAYVRLARSGNNSELSSGGVEDSLRKQFESKKLNWPPSELYIRSFKYDRMLEVWVKDSSLASFRHFKTYKVCMQSGSLGPKRMEGDYQMPEGFYYINEFNPNSNFHLALGLNYPNASDRILSDYARPGGDIYIHGKCVSTGCIAIDNKPIEELYLLANAARNEGQEFIPVHVFPVKYDVKKSFEYLATVSKDNQPLQEFAVSLKAAFDYFEAKKRLPLILVNRKGSYLVQPL